MSREPAKWRPMTDEERAACRAVSPAKVRYPFASPPKKIGRDLSAQASVFDAKITDKQAVVLWQQVVKYRRQIPADIVAMAPAALSALGVETKGEERDA